MRKIQMVDLKSQYLQIKDDIDKAISNVIDSTKFIRGPIVNEFENNLASYLNVNHVIACANGTDALQIALMSLDLKPGDEVITPDFTFIATVEVIALLGLKPIIVDVNRETFNIDIKRVKECITERTRAIIPVHLFGQCANMEEINEIASTNNLYVVEDTAQATGAEFSFSDGSIQKAGTIGTIGTTSFFPSKNLGCYGDGGAIFTNDSDKAEKIRSIINHGMKVRYYHDNIGVNSRLDSIQAAILNVKLKLLDTYNKSRQKAAEYYNKAFENIERIEIPKTSDYTNHIYHQYTLKLNGINRNDLKEYFNKKEIPSMIYYPVPLHMQKAFQHYGFDNDKYPVTNELSKIVLSLPMHTELEENQLEYITSKLIDGIYKLK